MLDLVEALKGRESSSKIDITSCDVHFIPTTPGSINACFSYDIPYTNIVNQLHSQYLSQQNSRDK